MRVFKTPHELQDCVGEDLGATDWLDVFGAEAEKVIRQRGRWHSDIARLYQRALAETHLRGSAAVADAAHADLESLCRGWVQPATFR